MLAEREEFQQKLEALYRSLPGDKLREMAWNRFLSLQLPTKKSEVYRYVKLRDLYSDLPPLQKGIEVHSLPKGVELLPMEKAVKNFGSYLNNRIPQILQGENDPFAALNGALYPDGVFLYVSPGMKVEAPVEISFLCEEGGLAMPRLLGSVGKGAEVTLSLTTRGKGRGNILSDWNIEEGGKLEVVQQIAGEGHQLQALRGTVKRGATCKVTAETAGSPLTRLDAQFDLVGEGASADIGSLADLRGQNEAHVNILIRHLAPHTTSNQLIKNILRDHSHSSFEGKIFVDPIAAKTEAYQLNANLLLSEGARAESKPNLEIFNEDVKASHGATFGQIEPELLFYLRARGLSKEKAVDMLIQGFSSEVRERCPNFLL